MGGEPRLFWGPFDARGRSERELDFTSCGGIASGQSPVRMDVMRIRMWMGITFAACFLTLALPWAGHAQKFQEPTQDELRMTDDPKAPGAPAVFLYREEVTDNYSHYVSCHARIKVLTEAGKEWATVEVPYFPGYQGKPIIDGRTIHPDGSVYPLNMSEADLLQEQQKAIHVHKIVFNLPTLPSAASSNTAGRGP